MKIFKKLIGIGKEKNVTEEKGDVAEERREKLLAAKTKLRTGILSTEKRRINVEKDLEKLRNDAKDALRVGNQMEFKKTTRRYGMLSERANTLATLEEFMHSNLILIENAEFANWIGEIMEKNLNPTLESLKLDDPQIKENLENLGRARERLASQIDTVSETIEVGMPGVRTEDIETELKEELLAELSAEGEDIKEIEKKISERMSH